jgi:hypothetical protein
MEVNDQFFDMSRNYICEFTQEKLRDVQQRFLLSETTSAPPAMGSVMKVQTLPSLSNRAAP